MENANPANDPELLAAFRAYEQQTRIQNTKVGCFLVVTLMPAGSTLDWFVYPEWVPSFFGLRLICSALAALLWGGLYTRLGRQLSHLFGVIVPLLPVVFIAIMIAMTDGFLSPYYAGLNLVLLAVGAVLRWTFMESIIAVALVLVIYLTAGLAHLFGMPDPGKSPGTIFNNFYFLVLMDIIVVVGTYFQYRQRLREFSLRFTLDRNRKELEQTNRKLIEMDQVKSRFFANISHELRTPLTLLIAPLESLANRWGPRMDAAERELLRTMQSNGMRLLRLINDLLDLVRLESGRLEIKREPVAVEEFARGMTTAVRKVAEDKRLRIETVMNGDAGTVMADRDKLEKVVLNLLFNAIKFTAAGGRVELRVTRRPEELELQVTDTGMGISPEHLPHIFDRFWQADTSSRRKYQGTGIGLALVKELVEAHGGQITAQSEVGRGTTMIVQLPCESPATPQAGEPKTETPASPPALQIAEPAPAPAPVVETAPTEEWLTGLYRRAQLFPSMTSLQDTVKPFEMPGAGARPKVLIADDEPDMLRFLRSQLTGECQVLESVDGLQAVEKASQFLPDLVLVDMMMPEKDGLQVCRELRAKTSTASIPIIMLTARADEETKLSALAAGASDFLTKPFSTTELHVRVRNLIHSHQFQRNLARQKQQLEAALEQLKETETQLVQSEKLASLGRLSAGLIHEINNPLNYAKTNLYSLKNKGQYLSADQQAEYAEILKDVEDGINRVRTIVSDLRSFTHPRTDQLGTIEVAKMVTTTLRFLSHDISGQVQVETSVPDDMVITGNVNQITQILINLLQNSIDAMKEKTYATGQPSIWIEARRQPGREILLVRDNGNGIKPEVVSKIFDPFFTTKDVGKGMGMGLAICYRIMQDHGGQISVRSQPGEFCEFALEFPKKP